MIALDVGAEREDGGATLAGSLRPVRMSASDLRDSTAARKRVSMRLCR